MSRIVPVIIQVIENKLNFRFFPVHLLPLWIAQRCVEPARDKNQTGPPRVHQRQHQVVEQCGKIRVTVRRPVQRHVQRVRVFNLINCLLIDYVVIYLITCQSDGGRLARLFGSIDIR